MELTAQHHHEHPADPRGGHGKSATPGSHDRHAGHSVAMFRDKFWLSLALTIPVVVWSADVQHWIGYTAPVFPGSRFVPPILGTIVFFYGGIVFIRGAWGELASRKPGMMTLISLAILVAFSTSLAATFAVFEVDVWWELATLITIMVLGHWLEMKAIAQAHGALDLLAALLFYVALGAGALTFAYWWMAGDKEHALIRTATVLIIACPHALGLAIPLVIAISTSIGAKNGLLVKDRLALERARNLNMVIFDKTGTLTRGSPGLSGIATASDTSDEELLAMAASVEADSEHPIAKAIVTAGKKRGLQIESAIGFEALAGRGTKAVVRGETINVGGPRLLADLKAQVPPEIENVTRTWATDGRTVLYVIVQSRILGALAVEDEIRPESVEAIELLHNLGIQVAMITGDSQSVADSVAHRLKIDEVAAQVLPADKAAAVKKFQSGGKRVAMVGDGVNDAPALATADVGIAIGAGTDVAIESAGIVLVRSDPRDVVGAIELSRATYRKMVQNLIWATAYNLVAIPVAAGLFVRWGLDLPMSVGAIAMSMSTIIVAANAQLLRRLNLRRENAKAALVSTTAIRP
jgi:P-type Cu2+ transporter